MADTFDPYYVWLGIPPDEQPANHYRLLGLRAFESNADVIDHAADRQMAHLRTFSTGERASLAQRLLNEVAAARVCLLDPRAKTEYDARLRAASSQRPGFAPTISPPANAPRPVAAIPLRPQAIPVTLPTATPVAPQAAAPSPVIVSGGSSLRRSKRSSPIVPIVVVGVLAIAAAVVINAMNGQTPDGGDGTDKPSSVAADDGKPNRPNAQPKSPVETPRPPVDGSENASLPPQAPSVAPMPDPLPDPPDPASPADPPKVPPIGQRDESPADSPPVASPPPNDPPSVGPDAPFESLLDDPTSDQPPSTPANRLPVPDDAATAAKEKEIRALLSKEFAQTRPQEVWELGRKLLTLANETKSDPAGRYVMYKLAIDRAAKAGDAETARAAAERIAKEHEVDRLETVGSAVLEAASGGVPVAARPMAMQHTGEFARQAFAADRLGLAKSLGEEWLKLAAQLRDANATVEAREYKERIAAAEERWPDVAKALEKLKTAPDDGPANAIAGKYLCFVKGDWPRGLDSLAKGDDAALKSLAEADFAAKNDASASVDVAEQWRRIGEAANKSDQPQVLGHALNRFAGTFATATGLAKKRAVDGLHDLQMKHGMWLDLLAHTTLARDGARGEWLQIAGGGISGRAAPGAAILNTIIEPHEDYEIASEFTWPEKVSDIFFFIPVGDRCCIIELFGNRNTTSWIDTVDGRGDSSRNPTRVKPTSISAGVRCSMHATIRVQGATAQIIVKLNGRDYMGFRGDIARLSRRTDITQPSD